MKRWNLEGGNEKVGQSGKGRVIGPVLPFDALPSPFTPPPWMKDRDRFQKKETQTGSVIISTEIKRNKLLRKSAHMFIRYLTNWNVSTDWSLSTKSLVQWSRKRRLEPNVFFGSQAETCRKCLRELRLAGVSHLNLLRRNRVWGQFSFDCFPNLLTTEFI